MDCREFRDVIDSYLCGELLVETNHEILRHAEQCPACREEMAARRSLGERLQRAGAQVRLSEEAKERLRESLREEAGSSLKARSANGSPLHRIFSPRLPLALAASALLVAVYLYFGSHSSPQVQAAELNETLMRETAEEHGACTFHYKDNPEPEAMNPIFRGSDKGTCGNPGRAGQRAYAAPGKRERDASRDDGVALSKQRGKNYTRNGSGGGPRS
jgi:hypothetical protein